MTIRLNKGAKFVNPLGHKYWVVDSDGGLVFYNTNQAVQNTAGAFQCDRMKFLTMLKNGSYIREGHKRDCSGCSFREDGSCILKKCELPNAEH